MKRFLLHTILIFFTVLANAQDNIEVTSEYPGIVTNGQQFSVTYSVNAGGGEFNVPSFNGFYKIMGPQTSYSQSTQIINGKISRQVSYSYVYYLQATKEGKFVIPPAIFSLKGKEYKSDSMRIEVVWNASQATSSSSKNDQNAGVSSSSGDLFVNLGLNRREVYAGEPVLATVKLFTKVDLQGINEIKYPSFNNFLRTDLETPPLTSLQQENVNGSIYGTGVIQQFLLYPQVAGDITIDPVQLTVLVQQRTTNPDPFFGDFFSSYQTTPRTIASKPMTVKVKALPGVKPDDFSGVVGKLNMKASLSVDSVKVNDAVNFKVTITGTGNLKIASNPTLKLPPDIEIYDPKVTEAFQNGTSGTIGSKTFEYILIPRHYGEFSIPPITYSYFNTTSGKYETLTTDEYKFYAQRVDGQSDVATVYSGVSKEDVQYLGKDIRFIRSEAGKLFKPGKIISESRSFYSIYGFALAAFLVVLFIRREHVRRNSDLSLVKNRKAGKIAGKRLHAASVCLKNKQTDKFYEEILKALWGYLSDKLNIPVSELTRSNASVTLKNKGVDDEKIADLNRILDTCEYARFAPSASNTEAENIYEGASRFIKSVENSIR
ncbi:MAG: BatD family protein [Chloroflexota bacterium]